MQLFGYYTLSKHHLKKFSCQTVCEINVKYLPVWFVYVSNDHLVYNLNTNRPIRCLIMCSFIGGLMYSTI